MTNENLLMTLVIAALIIVVAYTVYRSLRRRSGKIIIVRDGSVHVEPAHGADKKPKKKAKHSGKDGYEFVRKATDISVVEGDSPDPCRANTVVVLSRTAFTDATINVTRPLAGTVYALEILSTKAGKLFMTMPGSPELVYSILGRHTMTDSGKVDFSITSVVVDGTTVWKASDGRGACVELSD